MVRYINRKGQIYYLHQEKTKTDKPYYFFSMKTDGNLADSIPAGYEIFEHPNARIYLSKIVPKLVTNEEITMVENAVRNYAGLVDFKIVAKKKQIVVFLPEKDFDAYRQQFIGYITVSEAKLEKMYRESLYYWPMMRFVLEEKKRRIFRVDRWCYKGCVDGWLELDSGELESLVERYCLHLSKDSFYELVPW